MAKVMGTVKSIIGEATATAADGTVRQLQVGDQVFTDDVISTSALGSVQIALAGGQTVECGNDASIAMSDFVIGAGLNVALAAVEGTPPATPAAPTDVAALQAAIAAGADPSQVAEATAAGGAPGAGGGPDGGGGHSVVVLEQGNSSQAVNAGFSTEGAGIDFPAPEFELLPEEESPAPLPPGAPMVSVSVEVRIDVDDPESPESPGSPGGGLDGPVVGGNAISLIEGTNGDQPPKIVNFIITLDQAYDQDVQVTYQIVPGTATPGVDFIANMDPVTVTIPAGETQFIVTVEIVQDHIVEGDETFSIVLIDSVNATINPDSNSAIVTIVDDDTAPVANDDTNWVQKDLAESASGNVLVSQSHAPAPDGSFADVADTDEDGDALTVTTTGSFEGTYGTLVLNADGSYTYTLDNNLPTVQGLSAGETLTDEFSYTVTDGHNEPATATLIMTIFGDDDGVTITGLTVEGADHTVFENELPGGSSPNAGDLTKVGSFTIVAKDGIATVEVGGVTLTLEQLLNLGSQPVTVSTAYGDLVLNDYVAGSTGGQYGGTVHYSYTLLSNVDNDSQEGATDAQYTDMFAVTVTDKYGSSASATIDVAIVDDVPSISVADVQVPALQVDESDLDADANTSFAGVFTSAFGADGEGSITYALSLEGGNGTDSGLVDTATDEAVLLRVNGDGDIEGYTETSNQVVFTISVNGDGGVTLDQLRAVKHGDTGDHNDPAGLNADVVLLTATITDGDGDTAGASIDLGATITFLDDGPTITADGTVPTLEVDETDLDTDASASFAGVFSSAFGADGEGSITYALSIEGGNGTDSGVVDTATDEAVNLFLIDGEVVGSTSATLEGVNAGNTVFTISVDGGGEVTLDQLRAVKHSDPNDPDDAVSLATANLVTLTATITDKDGDTDTATVNLGHAISFRDDGPVLTSVMDAIVAAQSGITFSGTYDANFGADGLDFLSLALGNAAPGFSYTQAALGDGVTQVDVVGTLNFTFYYTTTAGDPALLEAYSDEALTSLFFTLAVHGNGTYDFTLHDNSFASQTTVDFTENMPSGQGTAMFISGGVGSYTEPTEFDIKITSDANQPGDTVNTSTHGLAAGNQNFEQGERLIFEFSKTQSALTFDVTKWNSGTVVLTLEFRDADGTLLGTRDVTVTKSDGVDPLVSVIQGADVSNMDAIAGIEFEFDRMDIVYASGSQNINIGKLSYGESTTIEDFSFNFALTATDGDGDTTAVAVLTVDLEGGDVAASGVTLQATSDDGMVLAGGTGDDILIGGAGDDILTGGAGSDTMTGGAGADTFRFTDTASPDTITDFEVGAGSDMLDLSEVLSDTTEAFLQLVEDGGNTLVMVNTAGAGDPGDLGTYTTLVTLEGVTGVTLEQLLGNNQIIT